MGYHTHEWLRLFPGRISNVKNKGRILGPQPQDQPPDSPHDSSCSRNDNTNYWHIGIVLPLLSLAVLIPAFLIGALKFNIAFYQELVLSSAFSSIGAVVRLKLSCLNSRKGCLSSLQWIPWGTLTANIVASVVSALIAAVSLRYLADFDTPWSSSVVPAIKVGFAGSLSTVSTMVKEMFLFQGNGRSLTYALGSLLVAMVLGIVVFSPVVRS